MAVMDGAGDSSFWRASGGRMDTQRVWSRSMLAQKTYYRCGALGELSASARKVENPCTSSCTCGAGNQRGAAPCHGTQNETRFWPPTYRRQTEAASVLVPPSASVALPAGVDLAGLQAALDVLAALLLQELLASIQQPVKPRLYLWSAGLDCLLISF